MNNSDTNLTSLYKPSENDQENGSNQINTMKNTTSAKTEIDSTTITIQSKFSNNREGKTDNRNLRNEIESENISDEGRNRDAQFFGLFEGTSVAEVEEIVDSIGVDACRTVKPRRANGVVLGGRRVVDGGLPLLLCFSGDSLSHRKNRCFSPLFLSLNPHVIINIFE